ncbi:MAG: FUSC family protein [Propionibacteriaceae bacterium]
MSSSPADGPTGDVPAGNVPPGPLSPRTIGREPSRLDPIAPDWLVRILAPRRAAVPWLDMVRTSAAVTLPLAIGVVVGQPGLGVFAAMGGLVGAFGDRGGTFTQRAIRTACGGSAGLLGLVVGRVTADQGAVAVLIVAALAVVSALISEISANLSFAGLQLLVYVAVAGGLPAGAPLDTIVLVFLAGVGWALCLSFGQTRIDPPTDEARRGVVGVVRSLARLLRTPADGLATQQQAVTRSLSAAYDVLASTRAVSSGRRSDLRRLSAVLTAASGLAGVALDYASSSTPVEQRNRVAAVLDGVADAVAHLNGRLAFAAVAGLAPGTPPPLATAFTKLARSVGAPTGGGRDSGSPGYRHGERGGSSQFLVGRKGWVFAARLGLTLAVAEIVSQLVPLEKPYWILLTAALVLKPDLGSVFARGVQRTLGTLVGVGLGIAIVELVPPGPWLLVPILVLAFGFPLGASRNYGMLATFITPLVLLLLDFGNAVSAQIALDRLIDTTIGAAVVLVVGYLAWPSTWRPRLGDHIATAVDALAGYVRVAFDSAPAATGTARRRTYRSLSDVRSELQSTLAEPPPLSRQAAAWWPLIVQLERATDDLRHASIVGRQVGPLPPESSVERLAVAVDDLAESLRAHRPPSKLDLPDDDQLADVASDIEGARRIAAGPDHGRDRPQPAAT